MFILLHWPSLPSPGPPPHCPALTPFFPLHKKHQKKSKLHGATETSGCSGTTLTVEMDEELHYASLNFHGMNPSEDTSTEYSEVRTQWGTHKSIGLT